MRLRNNPNAGEILKLHPEYVIIEPTKYKNKFSTLFKKNQPIHIEIGMGKGDFIINMAKAYPNINFIGIEKYASVLVVALKKIMEDELELSNLKLICLDANHLFEVFSENEINEIYLNFSDPWPKTRHAKRRLTYKDYLIKYQLILKQGGSIILKTDHRNFFESSLMSMNEFNMKFIDVCLDLHRSFGYENNIETEYENEFKVNGPIYRIETNFK